MTLAGYQHLLRAADRLRWDEAAIVLDGEAAALAALDAPSRAAITELVAGFCVAEVAVADHLAPFEAAADDPLLRACFSVQADDERRHARFFARVAREVVGIDPVRDAAGLAAPGVRELFGDELPSTAARLAGGDVGLDDAVALYHLVLEGIVFHAGQEALGALLEDAGTLRGTAEGVRRVQGDERWHVGLGVRCLQDNAAAGADLDIADLERRGAACWGPVVARMVDVDAVLARHRRRLRLASGPWSAVGSSP
jgi:ribonucleoside-diphosphate reductase beta chain